MKCINNSYTFLLSFKETTHAYLLKKLIMHNKNLIPLSSLPINCMSPKSTLEILSLNKEYYFLFSNFLIIDQCSCSANCCIATSTKGPSFWLKLPLRAISFTSVAIPLPERFFMKKFMNYKSKIFPILFFKFYSRILCIAESLELTLYSMQLLDLI